MTVQTTGTVGVPNVPSGDAALLAKYGISGLGTQWTGSVPASGNLLTFTANHDFQVGHGLVLENGFGYPWGTTYNMPGPPTVTPAGAAGTTSYAYCVAAVLDGGGNEFCAPASANGTTATGNAALSATNYNNVTFALSAFGVRAYAIYGRTAGALQLLGMAWFVPPSTFSAGLNGSIPSYMGANLVASTGYTYQMTGVDYAGNESAAFSAGTVVTQGLTVKPITVTWKVSSPVFYQFYNIYRNGFLIAQVNPPDNVWEDYGGVAPTAQALPTGMQFKDTGHAFPTGAVGVPFHVSTTPLTTGTVPLGTTVAAIPAVNQVQLADSVNNHGVTSALVIHDDTSAIQNALNAQGSVTLPKALPSGQPAYYFVQSVNIPAGCTLEGQPGGWVDPVSATSSTNPLPNGQMATLCMRRLNAAVISLTVGSTLRNVRWFWPFQINAQNTSNPLPQCAVFSNQLGTVIEDIVDCNSFIGIWHEGGGPKIRRIETAMLRWCVVTTGGEARVSDISGNPAVVYSTNGDVPRYNDSAAIRSWSPLLMVDRVFVDKACEAWWTATTQEGANFSNIASDDNGFCDSLIIDSPASPQYLIGGGATTRCQITAFNGISGSGPVVISAPPNGRGNNPGNGTVSTVEITDSFINGALHVNGPLDVMISGSSIASLYSNPFQLGVTTPMVRVFASATNWAGGSGLARFNVQGGLLKAYLSACSSGVTADYITAGTLFVIDNDTRREQTIRLPPGTVLSTGNNTVGYIIVPNNNSGNGKTVYFNVIDARGNGTSASDSWALGSGPTTLFTTGTLSGGQNVGAAGELSGFGVAPIFQNTAIPSGGGITVVPVVFHANAGSTTTGWIECTISYCVTPVSN